MSRKLLLPVLLVVAVAAGAYLLSRPDGGDAGTPSRAPETVRYFSKKYPVALSYPRDLQPQPSAASPDEFVSFVKREGGETPYAMYFSVLATGQESLDGFMQTLEAREATALNGGPAVDIRDRQTIDVAGRPAVQRAVWVNSDAFPALEAFVFEGGTVYQFGLDRFAGGELTDDDRTRFDHLLDSVTLEASN
jgi:hypothetical protein